VLFETSNLSFLELAVSELKTKLKSEINAYHEGIFFLNLNCQRQNFITDITMSEANSNLLSRVPVKNSV
jgi:hypothetical protein